MKIPFPVYFENLKWRTVSSLVWMGLLFIGIITLFTLGNHIYPAFNSVRNLGTIMTRFIYLALPSVAAVLLFSSGSLDLSVGAIASLTAAITALMVQSGASISSAIAAGLSLAMVIGIINAAFTGLSRISGTIFTLVMAYILRSITNALLNGLTIPFDDKISSLTPVSWILLIMVSAAALIWLQYPGIGIKIAEKNAKKQGLWSFKIINLGTPYLISAVCAAFAGLLFLGHLRAATPTGFSFFEIDILLVLVMSGTCFYSGYGNIGGVLLTAIYLTVFQTLIAILGINVFIGNLLKGLLIITSLLQNYVFHAIIGLLYRRSQTKNIKNNTSHAEQ